MIRNKVVNEAIDYIMQHIEEEITIEDVANHCHFSKYYFSRVFKEETNESIYSFIKRVRMEQSAFRLKVEREKSITDIGYQYGYTPSNYSSVFKQHLKKSPTEFRKGSVERSIVHPFFHMEKNELKTLEECKKLISIENVDDIKVIYERRKGNYHNLGKNWCDFINKYKKYHTPESLLLERTYNDPSITDVDNCMYDICMSVSDDCPLENTTIIQGGRFVVYHFSGIASEIYTAYQSLFNVWFPESRCEIDERYGFDIYHEVNDETGHFVMDIYIPIK